MKANSLLFRCSKLGGLMTKEFGSTSKQTAIDTFIAAKYGRYEDNSNKYTRKGNDIEEDNITILSNYFDRLYIKNKTTYKNDFITGTPDLLIKSNGQIEIVEDIKSSWSIHTFFKSQSETNKNYYWQGQGYMYLTGAKLFTLRYILNNVTLAELLSEKRKLQWQMQIIDPRMAGPEYFEKLYQLEKNLIYDMDGFIAKYGAQYVETPLDQWNYDIPLSERIYSVDIPRNENDIKLIQTKVEQARKFLITKKLCN